MMSVTPADRWLTMSNTLALAKLGGMPARDHLFISYAIEDAAMADWLARRLASLGFAVWYARFKLLGGEPWPQDIEDAIDQRTFRMLALISHASKDKKNPTGERKNGEAVGQREKLADFVIPLNVNLATSEVPWDLMGTQYIDFSHSWAKGLTDVLAKLEKVQAPRALTDGLTLVQQTVIDESAIRQRQEVLSTNCLRMRDIPGEVLCCTFREDLTTTQKETLRERWAFRMLNDNTAVQRAAFGSTGQRLPRKSGAPEVARYRRSPWHQKPRCRCVARLHVARSTFAIHRLRPRPARLACAS